MKCLCCRHELAGRSSIISIVNCGRAGKKGQFWRTVGKKGSKLWLPRSQYKRESSAVCLNAYHDEAKSNNYSHHYDGGAVDHSNDYRD